MRNVWIVFVSTLAAFVIGGFYDYARSFFSDVSRGGALEAWFTPGTTMYLMPWLFAFGGLLSSIISVAMCNAMGRGRQTAGAPGAAAGTARTATRKEQAPARGKPAPQASSVAGMPSFDFEKAAAEIKSAPGTGSASPAGPAPGAAAQGDLPPSAQAATANPPQEPQR